MSASPKRSTRLARRQRVVDEHLAATRVREEGARARAILGRCPACWRRDEKRVFPLRIATGPWGDLDLAEGVCGSGHYWAVDLTTRKPVLALGYRMDREGFVTPAGEKNPGRWWYSGASAPFMPCRRPSTGNVAVGGAQSLAYYHDHNNYVRLSPHTGNVNKDCWSTGSVEVTS